MKTEKYTLTDYLADKFALNYLSNEEREKELKDINSFCILDILIIFITSPFFLLYKLVTKTWRFRK